MRHYVCHQGELSCRVRRAHHDLERFFKAGAHGAPYESIVNFLLIGVWYRSRTKRKVTKEFLAALKNPGLRFTSSGLLDYVMAC